MGCMSNDLEMHVANKAELGRTRRRQRCLDVEYPLEQVQAAVRSSAKRRADIAREAGISEQHLRRVLTGKRACLPELARRLIEVSGWPIPRTVVLGLDLHPNVRSFVLEFAARAAELEARLGTSCDYLNPNWGRTFSHKVAGMLLQAAERRREALEACDNPFGLDRL